MPLHGRSSRSCRSGSGFIAAGPVPENRTARLVGPVRLGPPAAGPTGGSVKARTGPHRVHPEFRLCSDYFQLNLVQTMFQLNSVQCSEMSKVCSLIFRFCSVIFSSEMSKANKPSIVLKLRSFHSSTIEQGFSKTVSIWSCSDKR